MQHVCDGVKREPLQEAQPPQFHGAIAATLESALPHCAHANTALSLRLCSLMQKQEAYCVEVLCVLGAHNIVAMLVADHRPVRVVVHIGAEGTPALSGNILSRAEPEGGPGWDSHGTSMTDCLAVRLG